MLFLFSDVGEADAPTRVRVGSQADIARTLAPAGDAGLTLRELIAAGFGGTGEKPVALATGEAGIAYCAIPSWFTPLSRIMEHGRGSWLSRRCFRERH